MQDKLENEKRWINSGHKNSIKILCEVIKNKNIPLVNMKIE